MKLHDLNFCWQRFCLRHRCSLHNLFAQMAAPRNSARCEAMAAFGAATLNSNRPSIQDAGTIMTLPIAGRTGPPALAETRTAEGPGGSCLSPDKIGFSLGRSRTRTRFRHASADDVSFFFREG